MTTTITFGGAVKPAAPAICDPNPPTGTGATNSGIGFTGADGALVASSYIGGPAVNLRIETDGNLATP